MSERHDLVFGCVVVALVLGLLCCTATGLTATCCEGEQVCLYCRPGLKLNINDVTYGRENAYTCAHTPAYSAKCSRTVTNYVKPKCDGQEMCTFSVTNSALGSDPCPNVYKYVVINYECVGSLTTDGSVSVRTVIACENQQLSMECPTGQRVDILRAVYGRGDTSTCRRGIFYSTNCGTNMKSTLAAACYGRQSCLVTANNALAGYADPCPGTYKYLMVEFRCL